MNGADLPVPGLIWGNYPERLSGDRRRGGLRLPGISGWLPDRARALVPDRRTRVLAAFRERRRMLRQMHGADFGAAVRNARLLLQAQGLREQAVAEAFAAVGVVFERSLGLRLFDTQVIAADIVLGNQLAEMATGEGKTCAVALAAATTALAGIPVHVITANDYLAGRDADLMRPVYAALGLAVGAAIEGQPPPQRRAAYAAAVTYCTAKELVFDYLRDGLERRRDALEQRVDEIVGTAAPPPLLRGLCAAIVDEADSILIDEARVPFILSQPSRDTQQAGYLHQALELARRLDAAADFRLASAARTAELTVRGRERLEILVRGMPSVWQNRLHRDETLCAALAALHLYRRDQHYLVRDGKVLIIDDTTGRTAPGRAWSQGLHQLIELKEGCKPTPPQTTAAQITYQRFFPRYVRLGGLSGTLMESAGELRRSYDLPVRRVPLRQPDRRITLPARLFPNREALWDAVAHRATAMAATGRPVLVGTDTVADSDALSGRLRALGFEHDVLNARNDQGEAEVVARAGRRGAITVATNMAGRGTDIGLEDGVADLGGLHVICCQCNAARRIDRQLAGRCARQGDPGSVEIWLAADAALYRDVLPGPLLRGVAAWASSLPGGLVRWLTRTVQRSMERRHALERARLQQREKDKERRLSFVGRLE